MIERDALEEWMDPIMADEPLEPDMLADMISAATHPALLLVKTLFAKMEGAPGCWLGGLPTLPPEIDWPWKTKSDPTYEQAEEFEENDLDWPDLWPQYPLHFIAQINLASVPLANHPLMPKSGTLFFFFDYLDHLEKTPGSIKVIHVDGDVSDHPERQMPAFPDNWEDMSPKMCWFSKPKVFTRWPFTFHAYETVQSEFFPQRDFYDATIDRQIEVDNALRKRAEKIERDVEKPTASFHPIRKERALHKMFDYEGMRDRTIMQDGDIPLLQVEMDNDLGFEYSSILAFYITPEALRAKDFDQAYAFTLI